MNGPLILEGEACLAGARLFPPLRLTLQPGKWLTLLGPSGVGKTTLLRLIAGLPVAAEFRGQITGARPAALMAQDPGLLPWATVAQNITLGPRLRGTRPDQARLQAILDQTGLADHAQKRPAQLSGGQRQRAALARALMEDRPLFLLDEPFSALDIALRHRMQDLTASLLRDHMVLMISHDPAEAARLSDHIYVLTRAGLQQVSPPADDGRLRPRPLDGPDTRRCEAELIALLMAAT
ncbi:ABC transporter ATP-binding protein [Xinfangfangia sp. D13-10-4-6]|uniref:ABC transporter ATP-binding protein n=1 Tax=Pseudogemmobacter hezensis TaxID=2737662 RepID=UPI00155313FA|nr:ATP-binding cassette domain-containing protein [Pseudogemmobacter hezensis]NPD16898.1 ABC transporter ATP-binding protein [Pseudogemmobacter hezensis]